VKVVWSRDGMTSHHDSWFLKEPNEMLSTKGSHLALDYVATRDIMKGEELFLDYGDEWEKAWQHHTANWESRNAWSAMYTAARAWNEVMGDQAIRTAEEASCDPYAANLQIRCHIHLEEEDWGPISDWGLLDYGFPCDILDRSQDGMGNYSYKVRMTTEATDRWDFEFESPETLDIDGVPRSAIRFFDAPFTSDLHLQGAFRHSIELPDELMQDTWKNHPKKSKSKQCGMTTLS
jgi:hypothetical protein